jgi:hypothetical protein
MIDIIQVIGSTGTLLVAIVTIIVAVFSLFGQKRSLFELKKTVEEDAEESKTGKSVPEEKGNTASEKRIILSERQYQLLRQYHSQGLEQSKISFWFSLIFAALGFVVIITATFTMESGVQLTAQGRAFITLLAGTIIDAVAALFFVQSNKARELMTNFFDRLRADRKLEEALNLCREIKDKNIQSKVQTLLTLRFTEIQINDGLLSTMLGPQVSVGTDSKSVTAQEGKVNSNTENVLMNG